MDEIGGNWRVQARSTPQSGSVDEWRIFLTTFSLYFNA
jgi:hypothetical protein